ncbi:MAG: WecB/TagA/CpsF family glycosyltransferase [Hyphomicrobiales bacterium]
MKPAVETIHFLGLRFNALSLEQTLDFFSNCKPGMPFRYLVTPNVQHVVMADKDPTQKPSLDAATLSVCDSQPIRMLARLKGHNLPLVTGSDLTLRLFDEVIQSGDELSVVCASDELKANLIATYPDIKWSIIVPPAGTVLGTHAFDECVSFIANSKARYTFVCLGAPKSEMICHIAAQQQNSTGMALCVGASLEFMTGDKKRAPKRIRGSGFEWLYRLIKEPRRLYYRYASAFFPLLILMLRELKTKTNDAHGPHFNLLLQEMNDKESHEPDTHSSPDGRLS